MWLNKLKRCLVSAFIYELVITAYPESESIDIELQSGIVITSEVNEYNAQENLDVYKSTQLDNKQIDRSIERVDDSELVPSVRVGGKINRIIKTGKIYSTEPSFDVHTNQEIGKIGNN